MSLVICIPAPGSAHGCRVCRVPVGEAGAVCTTCCFDRRVHFPIGDFLAVTRLPPDWDGSEEQFMAIEHNRRVMEALG